MKILLIRLSSMGDIILTTAGIRALKNSCPDAEIDYLVYQRFHKVIEHNPLLHRIIQFPKSGITTAFKKIRPGKMCREIRSFLRSLRKTRYDHIIDLHHVTDSALCAILARGKKRSGHRSQLLTLFFTTRASFPVSNREAEEYAPQLTLKMLSASGLLPESISAPELSFHPGEKSLKEAVLFLKKNNPEHKSLIGLNPSASRPGKMWPAEHFIETGKQLAKNSTRRIPVFGGLEDAALVEKICSGIGKSAFPVIGLPIQTAFAIFQFLNLLITNDTAALHAATALKTPLIGLFGPSNYRKFAPSGAEHTILKSDTPCSPCPDKKQKTCTRCMKQISVSAVIDAANEILNKEKQ